MTSRPDNFGKALARFEEALAWPTNPATRDSAILRFELTYETAWKAAQAAVRASGLAVNGPKESFAGALQLGWIADEVIWKEMIVARNESVHVYRESLADALYARLPLFAAAFKSLHAHIQANSQAL